MPVSLSTFPIDVNSLTDIDFVILLAEDDDGSNQDWDALDYVHITYSIDGGSAVDLLWVESEGDLNTVPRIDDNFDGIGEGTEITSIFSEFVVSNIATGGGSSIVFTLEFQLESGDEDIAIDNIRVFDTYSPSPSISVSSAITGLNYVVATGPSGEQTFTVEGSALTNDISLSAPTDFEISETSGSGFGSGITLTQTGGTVATTTIYARLKSGLAVNSYLGDVDVTSLGATPKTVSLSGNVFNPVTNSLVLTAVFDGPLPNGYPKGVEIFVLKDIADLSLYGLGSANNGGGTDGQEFTFPAVAVTAGTYIYISQEITGFTDFFGFAPDYTHGSMGINGDDAVELFESGEVIDVIGDIDVDGSGEAWDHLDGWAYRVSDTGPDGSTFVLANWTFSGINQLEGGVTNAATTSPVPIGTYSNTLSTDDFATNNFKIYPNPTSLGFINIASKNSGTIKATVFDILGKQVIISNVIDNKLDVSNLNQGIYIMRLTQNNATISKKLVIK